MRVKRHKEFDEIGLDERSDKTKGTGLGRPRKIKISLEEILRLKVGMDYIRNVVLFIKWKIKYNFIRYAGGVKCYKWDVYRKREEELQFILKMIH